MKHINISKESTCLGTDILSQKLKKTAKQVSDFSKKGCCYFIALIFNCYPWFIPGFVDWLNLTSFQFTTSKIVLALIQAGHWPEK